jgi:hypothetical protein
MMSLLEALLAVAMEEAPHLVEDVRALTAKYKAVRPDVEARTDANVLRLEETVR